MYEMTHSYVDLPIKDGDFQQTVSLPEGNSW